MWVSGGMELNETKPKRGGEKGCVGGLGKENSNLKSKKRVSK